MTRRLLRSSMATVAALLVIIAGASLAKADDALWIYANCADGSLASADNGGRNNAVVFGSAAFCGLRVLDSSFGVAVWKAGATSATVLSYNLRKYNLVGSRKFGMQVSDRPGTFGVCLVASPTMKISCAKVVFHDSGYVEFRTIEPTDALVNAKITGSQVAIDPRCGACF